MDSWTFVRRFRFLQFHIYFTAPNHAVWEGGALILDALRCLALFTGLLLAARRDCAEKIIPNRTLAVLAAIRGILLAAEAAAGRGLRAPGLGALYGCMLGGGMFLVLYIVSRRGVGAGDVKLMAVAGLYLGEQIIKASVLSLGLAAAWGLVRFLTGKTGWKQGIPFAPFAAAGILLTVILETACQNAV